MPLIEPPCVLYPPPLTIQQAVPELQGNDGVLIDKRMQEIVRTYFHSIQTVLFYEEEDILKVLPKKTQTAMATFNFRGLGKLPPGAFED